MMLNSNGLLNSIPKTKTRIQFLFLGILSLLVGFSKCGSKNKLAQKRQSDTVTTVNADSTIKPVSSILYYVRVNHPVKIKDYFGFLDSIVHTTDSSLHIDEYVLVHANPWILDSLRATDYYLLKKRGIFLYDQPQKVILHQGDSVAIPDSLKSLAIRRKLQSTIIDVNIPEFKLRILQEGDTILTCDVRVGKNRKEYLAVAKHKVVLRTPIGEGEIVRISKDPYVINPDTGKKYERTCRDDKRYTKMPIIPWLEPSINGVRYGAMIHPTTNPVTLGKAYSHGCVGTTEADAWTIYYNAPLGTKVKFRYDLQVVDEHGDTLKLKDIYKHSPKLKKEKV